MSDLTLSQWRKLAQKRLALIVEITRSIPLLMRRGPRLAWAIELQLVNQPQMSKLNQEYRGKDYPTDVLSFPVLDPFWSQGVVGQLVICLPVLKRQAKEVGHSAARELDVLLAHGVLHLLGLDHELGKKQANEMSKFEAQVLMNLAQRQKIKTLKRTQLGLIGRSSSGNTKE